MLLDDFARTCTILKAEKVRTDEGGWKTEYTDGETFINHQAVNTTQEVNKADQNAVFSPYSGLIDQGVELSYGDYFRDDMSGITYRVTNIPDEKQSPASASFSLKYFTAERKEVPT